MKKTLLLATAILLAVTLTIYSALWYWMATQIKAEMNSFFTEATQKDIHILPRTMGVKGYPGTPVAWFSGRVAIDTIVIEFPMLEAKSLFLPGKPLTVAAPEGFHILEPADTKIWSLDRLYLDTVIPQSLPDDLTREDLATWRDAGNTLVFSRIDIRKNSLQLTGSGNFLLDANLQPAGDLQARATGHTEFLVWLQQNGYIETREALLATAVLSSLSKTSPETNEIYMDVGLTLQNRTLFLGPLQLGVLPPIEWAWRSQPVPLR